MTLNTSLTLCRLMNPNDANIAGNVHGGTILHMIEEAGCIVSTRHCNKGVTTENGPLGSLARVEKTDFLLPMYVGEVAHLSAEITYCSKHSLEVKVYVEAENLFTGVKRFTNKATLWYVPVAGNPVQICEVPPINYPSPEVEEAGKQRYLKQKAERAEASHSSQSMDDPWFTGTDVPARSSVAHSVSNTQSTLIHLVGVQDCGVHGRALGGVVMKLMDEVAGICAARLCHTNVLTASMDAVDFHQPIMKGSLLHLRSRPIFTSNKSVLIQVVVIAEEHRVGISEKPAGGVDVFCACTAFFTYVSLSPQRKTLPIPLLQLESDEERARFEEGRLQYEKNKTLRRSSL